MDPSILALRNNPTDCGWPVESQLCGALSLGFNLALPGRCPACDAQVATTGRFCAICFREASLVSEPFCRRCGIPFDDGPARSICEACYAHPPSFGRARAVLAYDDLARRLILPLKYSGRSEVARAFASQMVRTGHSTFLRADLLVPVPMHTRRLRRRRYNQAALLALALSHLTSVPAVPDALIRTRSTAPLKTLSARSRRAEVSGAFRIRPRRKEIVDGARIVLVDDVMTSGATVNACTDALMMAGAACVDVVALARAVRPDIGSALELA